MTTYAIGDVQGCYQELRALLDKIGFREERDELWFAGDLVNRGPQSLEVLRFVYGLGHRAKVVLGNHDLHLLAAANGIRAPRSGDTLTDVLNAADCPALLDWLRTCPLIHWDKKLGFAMVHAGIPPQWDIHQALIFAKEVETKLQSGNPGVSLEKMYGNEPASWDEELSGWKRRRYIINALTRMRYCSRHGKLDLKHSGPPGTQASGLEPWFQIRARRTANIPIVFGHWATLELDRRSAKHANAIHTDTGCVWGNKLTAVELPGLKYTAITSQQPKLSMP